MTSYKEEEWKALINACRQKNNYKCGGLLPGTYDPAVIPPAGEGARWFITPVGAVLLAPNNEGRWSWLQSLQHSPLHLGPFVLSYKPSLNPVQQRKRERINGVRAARRENGIKSPNLPPLPNPGRLNLAVSGSWLKAERQKIINMSLGMVTRDLRRDAPQLIASINTLVKQITPVGRYAWTDPSSIKAFNSAIRGAAMSALVKQGFQSKGAKIYLNQHLRLWIIPAKKDGQIIKGPSGQRRKPRKPNQVPPKRKKK